jgi:hypothetical protein
MAKPAISIGDDTPTGEPENAPEGPYITPDDEGSRRRTARKPAKDGSARRAAKAARRPRGAVRTDF